MFNKQKNDEYEKIISEFQREFAEIERNKEKTIRENESLANELRILLRECNSMKKQVNEVRTELQESKATPGKNPDGVKNKISEVKGSSLANEVSKIIASAQANLPPDLAKEDKEILSTNCNSKLQFVGICRLYL